jgi:hypothetical protein
MPLYAAVNPKMSDAAVRKDYAAFITYAASDGQTVGTGDGQLPEGYAPIPAAWKTQALAAAAGIASGTPVGAATPSAAASTTPAQTTPAQSTSGRTTAARTSAGATAGSQQSAAASPTSAATTAATNPAANGATSPALSAGKTANDPVLPAMAAVVPVSAGAALVAALAIPPLTRRRRL